MILDLEVYEELSLILIKGVGLGRLIDLKH